VNIANTAGSLAALLSVSLSGLAAADELSFISGGKRISVEAFRPPGEGPTPAVIVLHGASGPVAGNEYVRRMAAAFASQGYAPYLVRYFDRTGTSYAGDAVIHQHFEVWRQTIADAVDFVLEEPRVDRGRVALMGYSLGAYLAVTQGAQDSRVAAVIEIAGGLDEATRARARRMAPTLILHGGNDRRVEVSEAHKLEAWLQKIDARYESHIYPGEGHLLSPVAALDALSRSRAFLDKHLR
jgi:dienelactone hydrolase